jgi:Holliday junction resolvase RusA-like endonuclease
MQFKLDIKPISVNQCWKGKRYKTNIYKSFEKNMILILPKSKGKFSEMLRIELFFGFSSPLADIDNPVKPILDIMQKKYEFNDNQIFELNIRKCIVSKGKEFISVSINNLVPFK